MKSGNSGFQGQQMKIPTINQELKRIKEGKDVGTSVIVRL